MSERLPYFKFFASIYLAADITLLPYEVQGIFNNVCAFYWTKDCKLKLEKVKRHILKNPDVKMTPDRVTSVLEILIAEQIIKHDKKTDIIKINFQDEQYSELSTASNKNSENGSKGAQKRWSKKGETLSEHKSESEKNPVILETEKKKAVDYKKRYLETIGLPEAAVTNHKTKIMSLNNLPSYLDKFNSHLLVSTVSPSFKDYQVHFNRWMYSCEKIEIAGESKGVLTYSLTKKT